MDGVEIISPHSVLSPSGSKIWAGSFHRDENGAIQFSPGCAASLAASKGFVDTRDNKAAAHGTAKHVVSDHVLRNPNGPHLHGPIKADGFSFEIDAEFSEHVNMYVTGVRALGGVQQYEQRVDTSRVLGVPGQGGTVDVSVEEIEIGRLTVGDAKFGWTDVAAEFNTQEIIYAAAKLDELDPDRVLFDRVRLMIFQPKRDDEPKVAEYSRAEIDEFMIHISNQAKVAWELYQNGSATAIEASKNPSDSACEWCKIRENCTPRHARMASMFPIVAEEPPAAVVEHLPPPVLDNETLLALFDRVDYIDRWCKDIRAEATRRAQAGILPGFKVIEGKKGPRSFRKEDRAGIVEIVGFDLGDALPDAFEPAELKTPTQLEKVYKRLKLSDEWRDLQKTWVVQSDGAPSIARLSEPGAALPNVIEQFGLVEAEK